MNNTKIEWTDHTWNPWHGCTKVSDGCKYCYMYRDKDRYGLDPSIVIKSKTKFLEPLKLDPFPQKKIFTCSWSDFFIKDADTWRPEAWTTMAKTNHIYQILTKRPHRIHKSLPAWFDSIADRVWLGVSVENQESLDRVLFLADLPGVRFASIEPIIGAVRLTPIHAQCLDWIIIGGESGNETGQFRYRPAQLEWFTDIIQQAKEFGIPCFVKQTGTHLAKQLGLKDRHGGDFNEWPWQIQFREFPTFPKTQ